MKKVLVLLAIVALCLTAVVKLDDKTKEKTLPATANDKAVEATTKEKDAKDNTIVDPA